MLKKIKSVYIIGIGGISLSALAIILKKRNIKVYGSDLHDSNLIQELLQKGFEIKIGGAKEYVEKCDALIYTSAISQDNEDLLYAKRLNKKIYSRAEILGFISHEYKTISIAGTHGKTTTTGMVSSIFLEGRKDPTIHIGGILNNINSNVRIGESDILITEACEYKDSFLELDNYVSIVLNVKPDHLDYFKDINAIKSSFQKFIQNTRKDGVTIINFDDELSKELYCDRNVITFGINGGDVQAKNITLHDKGRYAFDLFYRGKLIEHIKLPCFGKHNIYNALASISVALFYSIKPSEIKKGLENFKGNKRRFEYINKINENLIIHDYAHHPDEIKATIKTAKELGHKKLIVIFQPHTFTRTKDLYNEFLECFEDETWLLPIYPAREKPIEGITSKRLSEDLNALGKNCKYFIDFHSCKEAIINYKDKDTLFLILGAGDIVDLAEELE